MRQAVSPWHVGAPHCVLCSLFSKSSATENTKAAVSQNVFFRFLKRLFGLHLDRIEKQEKRERERGDDMQQRAVHWI